MGEHMAAAPDRTRVGDTLRLDLLGDMLADWRELWDDAAVMSRALHPAAKEVVARKSSDPHDALRELLPALSALHPEVIEIVRASLEMAATTISDVVGGPARSHANEVRSTSSQTIAHLEQRIEKLETFMRMAAAMWQNVGVEN